MSEMGPDDWLFIPTNGKQPRDAYVSDCPDDVDPRSEESPFTYTYEETLESDWDGDWCMLTSCEGAWLGWDIDVTDHVENVEDPDAVSFRSDTSLVVETTNGFHVHTIWTHGGKEWLADRKYDGPPGTDPMGDTIDKKIARSPWHDDELEVKATGLKTRNPPEDPAIPLSYDDEPILVSSTSYDGTVDIPDVAPGELPHCVRQLAEVRNSQLRYEYLGSPWRVDTHLGQVVVANGYSHEESLAIFEEFPPDKPEGFDRQKTDKKLREIREKMERDELSAPHSILTEAGVDVKSCDCAVHGEREELALPRTRLRDSDKSTVPLRLAERNVRQFFNDELEGANVFHAPQGLGKTVQASAGATEQARAIVTRNKDEHRDTCRYGAGKAGATVQEVVPFAESYLATISSVADEVMDLYRRGAQPQWLMSEYGDLVPEDVTCPYAEQFDGEIEADLLLMSPGHENVKQFRQFETSSGETVQRAIIYDDVNPASNEIEQNMFSLDEARAELNSLLQEIDAIPVDSMAQLMHDRRARRAVERLAIGNEDDDEVPEDPSNVWEALEAKADEDDAIRVNMVEVMRERPHVSGDTIIKLKVAAGAEIRGTKTFRFGDDMFCWVTVPNLREHPVVVTSATVVPHVTDKWMSLAKEKPEHISAASDWEAVRRAKGYVVVQTNSARNSRSGLGSSFYDEEDRDRAARRTNGLVDAVEKAEGERPGVVDSLAMTGRMRADTMNHARTWSNNDFKDKNVGVIGGATYFGDEWVEARAAFCGRSVEVTHEGKADCGDPVGDDLLTHMMRAPVDQAITRFGRAGEDRTVVYVDTSEVPEDYPTVDVSELVQVLNDTQERAVNQIADGGVERFSDLDLGVTDRQVRNVVRELEDMGLVEITPYALANGAYEVSGSSAIRTNTVYLPEISRDGAVDRPDGIFVPSAGETNAESGVQVTLADAAPSEPPG